jgi:hypothetical protein
VSNCFLENVIQKAVGYDLNTIFSTYSLKGLYLELHLMHYFAYKHGNLKSDFVC